ncbi:MAG: 30S ribosomal protein S16 [bacterium]|nr:30S ribosomal protein S16 [bacterium]
MLMIRLQRVGRKNDPSFRVVITEKANAAKSGAFLEIVGSYDARKDRVQLKQDRIQHWLSHGAKTSATVHNMLVNAKIINAPKVNALPSKKIKPEEAKTEAPAPAQKAEEMAPTATAEAPAEAKAEEDPTA